VSALTVLLIVGAGSYLIRLTMLVLLAGRPLPQALTTPVSLVGPAAVGALTVGALDSHGHFADLPTVVATAVSFAVVLRTGRLAHGLMVGFPVVWLLKALVLL
jgi:branched-subunit amino acid transport protein